MCRLLFFKSPWWSPQQTALLRSSLQHDNVSRADVETLVDAFPGQSIDFFGALRARVYDDKVCRV